MNVKRFKIVIAVYLFVFILACVFIPYNAYITVGNEYYDLGFIYRPVSQGEYENNVSLQYRTGGYYEIQSGSYEGEFFKSKRYDSQEQGVIRYELNKLTLALELIGLTVLFVGGAYILCKKEHNDDKL